ncbi:MAG: ribokinase [Sedimentisphaerales bacterium]|nr:ribokinase [Sedimentisphaerales bacterium]
MTGRSPKVVVIGGTYADMAIRCGQVPSPGQSVTGSALSYTITGPGPNQALEAALCGCEVYLISKIGGDPFAQMARNALVESGVNMEYVTTAEAMNTGVIVTFVNAAGENATCNFAGANSALQPRDITNAEEVIADANVCLIHGQLPQETIVSALRCTELYGIKVILNPARPLEKPTQETGDLPIEYFSADIVIPNLYEAADITETSAANIRTAKLIGSDLVTRGVAYAVITMGKRGCMVVDRNNADQIPAFDVDLVDHTASGDAFAGALAAYCAVENDVRAAVKFASAAGALACTKFGSLEALPTKAEIIELLQKEDIE